jgi:signal transduction histidine kinase
MMAPTGEQVQRMMNRFDVHVEDDLAWCEMNWVQNEQVLINLLLNVAQAADKDDSWITLAAARSGTDAIDGEQHILITVQDNGPGIPDVDLERIFEPFFTSKASDEGTGLGLSICQRIMEQRGGRIDVTSTPGDGACFTVRLPAANGQGPLHTDVETQR